MAEATHEGLKWAMRAGYGARGAIYVVIGIIALWAAIYAGQASGTKGALSTLQTEPMGQVALWAIAIGLFAYMVWRVMAGVADVEDHGSDAKGLFARAGQITTGILHGAIGVSVLGLAKGGSSGGGGGGAEDYTAQVMSMPGGRWLVGLGALILAGAGIYYAYKGWSGKYKEHLAGSSTTAKLDPLLKAGLIIYGGLLVIVAVSLGYAALTANPQQAGGLGDALRQLREMTFGRLLLGGAALGLLAFALYNFVEAAYRVVPRINGPDVQTLAARLKAA